MHQTGHPHNPLTQKYVSGASPRGKVEETAHALVRVPRTNQENLLNYKLRKTPMGVVEKNV